MAEYHGVGYGSPSGDVQLSTAGIDSGLTTNSTDVEGTGLLNVAIDAGTNTTSGWFTVFLQRNSVGGSGAADDPPVSILDDLGQVVARLLVTNNAAPVEVQYWNGATFVTLLTIDIPVGRVWKFDFHLILDGAGAGEFHFYRDEQPEGSVTGLSNSSSVLRRMHLRSSDHSGPSSFRNRYFYHEYAIGVGSESVTLGRRIYSKRPTGDSLTNVAWSGAFGDVDDGPVILDGVTSDSNTQGDLETYTFDGSTKSTTTPLYQVITRTMAQTDGLGIVKYQHVTRQGGVDYRAVPGFTPSVGVNSEHVTRYRTNPATGANWTVADLNASEFGVHADEVHSFVRIRALGTGGLLGGQRNIFGLAEVEFRATPGGAALGNIATVSSGDAAGAPSTNAFDANIATDWVGEVTGPLPNQEGQWVGIQLAVPSDVQEVVVTSRLGSPEEAPYNFVIDVSEDGVSWSPLWSEIDQAVWTGNEVRTFTRSVAKETTNVYRMLIDNTGGSGTGGTTTGGFLGLAQVEWRYSPGGTNIAPSGYYAGTWIDVATFYPVPFARDGNPATFYSSGGLIYNGSGLTANWIAMITNDPNVPQELLMQVRPDTFREDPRDFFIQRSLDGGQTFTTLQNYDNQAAWVASESRTFAI